jgi:ABC-type transport system substrate-binding protein
VFLGAAVPLHGPVSPGNKTWFWPDLPRYAFDREKASALLAELGLANRDADAFLEDAAGTEARFTLIHYKGNTSLERGAQVLKESFERVGVAMDLVPLEPGTLIERMLAGSFEAIFFNYVTTDPDPAMQRDFWLSSGSAHIWNISQAAPATAWEREMDALTARRQPSIGRTRAPLSRCSVCSATTCRRWLAAPRCPWPWDRACATRRQASATAVGTDTTALVPGAAATNR